MQIRSLPAGAPHASRFATRTTRSGSDEKSYSTMSAAVILMCGFGLPAHWRAGELRLNREHLTMIYCRQATSPDDTDVDLATGNIA